MFDSVNKTKAQSMKKWGITVLLLLGGLTMILPVLWMISSSFKFESDVFKMPMEWIPSRWNLGNYLSAVTDFPYFRWYLNTASVTLQIVFFILAFSSLSGYAFAKLPFKGRNIIFMLFIATMMIPTQVRVIPQFLFFKRFDLINTHAAVTLPWVYNAFSIFLMRQFFMTIPDELIEAAKLDGCNEYKTFFRIVLPLAKTPFMTLGVLSFTWGWNFYFGPLVYISDTAKQVLSVGIATFKTTYSENFAIQMAGATLALIPVIAIYMVAQKQFIEGIASTGVKG